MHILGTVYQAANLPVNSGVDFQQLEQGLLEFGQRIDEHLDQLIFFIEFLFGAGGQRPPGFVPRRAFWSGGLRAKWEGF